MVKRKSRGNYRAQQFDNAVILFAEALPRLDGYKTYFEKATLAGYPPLFTFYEDASEAVELRSYTSCRAEIDFECEEKLKEVLVEDAFGQHHVVVEQLSTSKVESDLIINGVHIPAEAIEVNSLTEDARSTFDLSAVDLYTVQTELSTRGFEPISPDTFGLIYFFPYRANLKVPLLAETCVRLTNYQRNKTKMEVFTYKNGKLTSEDYDFLLQGLLGCTAVVNLGFFLLKSLQGVTTRELTAVTVLDSNWLSQAAFRDLQVADDPIIEFCKANGCERIPLNMAASDCPYYTQCKHQPGERCVFYKAHCK